MHIPAAPHVAQGPVAGPPSSPGRPGKDLLPNRAGLRVIQLIGSADWAE